MSNVILHPKLLNPGDIPEWDGEWGDAKHKLVHTSLLADRVIDSLKGNDPALIGDCLPWEKTHRKLRFRPGEVTLWMGYNGHRKSMLLGQVATGFSAQRRSTVICSFEMSPYKSLERMVLQAAGSNDPTEAFVRRYCEWARVWFYDHTGPAKKEQVFGVIRYAETMGVRHIVVDSMMKVVAAEDDYNGQKEFVNQLCAMARYHEMHVHLVHHSRKAADESTAPSKQDAKGSGAITDQVDNVVVVWVNKRKERDVIDGKPEDEKEPDLVLIVDKQRNGAYEGKIGLWMHAESCQFLEKHGQREDLMAWPWHTVPVRQMEPGEEG